MGIDVRFTDITTDGAFSHGIFGYHQGPGANDIMAKDVVIATMGNNAIGIFGRHIEGADNITIKAEGVDIDTKGDEAHGIYGQHEGTGLIDIDITSAIDSDGNIVLSTIDTIGDGAHGVYGWHDGDTDGAVDGVDIDVKEATTIITEGAEAYGIAGVYGESTGNIDIDVGIGATEGSSITTKGVSSHGIYVRHDGVGAVDIDVQDVTIMTESTALGTAFDPFYGYTISHGIFAHHTDTGDVTIDVQGGGITTKGVSSHGIYGRYLGFGAEKNDVTINARDVTIMTESTALDPFYGETFSHGIFASHANTGDVTIDVQGGGITTKGVYSYGVYGRHEGEGLLDIKVRGGSVTTRGVHSYGVYGWHYGVGAVTIDVQDVDITTESTALDPTYGETFSPGVYGLYGGEGRLDIKVRGGLRHDEGRVFLRRLWPS